MLVFAASIWDGSDGPWPTEDAAIAALRTRRRYHRWTRNIEASLRANLVANSDGWLATRSTHESLLADADATLRVDHAHDIAAMQCPVLHLVASESPWWQALSNDEVIPRHAERIEIDGQHMLHLDQPDRVAAEIAAFLDRCDL